jgi:predicted dehydrogenase
VRPVRLAIFGAGIMGTNHVRIARSLTGVELAAVVDPELERAERVAAASGARVASSVDEVIGSIDAAVIAVPTRFHAPIALPLMAAGVHVLIEKPLAVSSAEARTLLDAAEQAGVVLAVGHVERFNAAVAELPRYLNEPLHIEASRLGPYSPRVSDGVIFDLMIHDLDIVASLAGAEATVVSASGVSRTVKGPTEDLVSATIQFSSGLTASFNTSRLDQQKLRTIKVTQPDSVVVADLVRQDIVIHRMSRHEYLADEGTRYRQSSVVEIPFIESRGEPLARELEHFARCVQTGERPLVDGPAGVRALELAELILSAVQHGGRN